MRLPHFSVDRPVTIMMVIVGLLVLGLFSLHLLTTDLLPNITNPVITVTARYPGAGPQEVEQDVTKVLETGLGTLGNLQDMSSTSQNEACVISLQFAWGTDMDTALSDVRAHIDQVKSLLPDAVTDINVFKYDTSQIPVMFVGVSSDQSLAGLQDTVKNIIVPSLNRVDGVASVQDMGGPVREVDVLLDPGRLQHYGVSVNQVSAALAGDNIDVSGGIIPSGDKNYVVRGLYKYQSVQQIENLPVSLLSGSTVALKNLGQVKETFASQDMYALSNGRPVIMLMVQKQSGANTVDVGNRVKAEIADLEHQLPGHVQFNTVFDESGMISQSVSDVVHSTIWGGVLAMLVLLLFLRNVRTTIVISIAIPFAIVTTFMLLYFSHMTLNLMTIGGLSLGVGHMVDYSIVVLESIYRFRKKGFSACDAAKQGTDEVGVAVMASAFTVACVFLPMVFVSGLAGQLFKPFALTVAFSQLAALFVSLTLIPLFSSRILGKLEDMSEGSGLWNRIFFSTGRWYDALDSLYRRVLVWSLARRRLVLSLTALITILSLALIPLVGISFMPNEDTGEISVDLKMPVGTVLSDTGAVMSRMSSLTRQIQGVQSVFTMVGSSESAMGVAQSNIGEMWVQLKPLNERKLSSDQVMEIMRSDFAGFPGAGIRVYASGGLNIDSSASGRPIQVNIKGDDLNELSVLAAQVESVMNKVPGTRQVGSSMQMGSPELDMNLNMNRMTYYGVNPAGLTELFNVIAGGQVVSTLDQNGTSQNVRLMLDKSARSSVDALPGLIFTAPGGQQLPLSELADFHKTVGPDVINRDNQSRVVYVYSDYAGKPLGEVTSAIESHIEQMRLPSGYSITFGGEQQDMTSSFASLAIALLLALLLVYMVMAGQFESFLYPLAIMFSIPVSITGVVLSLIITGRSFSVPAFIGVIMMSGIVVNNAIVLVDYINTLKKRGRSRYEAIVEAGPVRLRPILMTAFTTLFGLLPLALGLSQGSQMQAPMAIVVIGGLTVSTFLTLIIVPLVYTVFDDWGQMLIRSVSHSAGKGIKPGTGVQ